MIAVKNLDKWKESELTKGRARNQYKSFLQISHFPFARLRNLLFSSCDLASVTQVDLEEEHRGGHFVYKYEITTVIGQRLLPPFYRAIRYYCDT